MENEQAQTIRIVLDEAIAQGEYVNFANIIHSPSASNRNTARSAATPPRRTRKTNPRTDLASIRIIGAGLAGSECAYTLARRGHTVDLYEMRPVKSTPAHATSNLGELVCSNSSALPLRRMPSDC